LLHLSFSLHRPSIFLFFLCTPPPPRSTLFPYTTLFRSRIDVAVHSLKDLPTSLPAGLVLAAVPKRADPAEALVTREASITSIADLAAGAKLGTSSLRRVAQIRHLRAHLDLLPLPGNVPTRVPKRKVGR